MLSTLAVGEQLLRPQVSARVTSHFWTPLSPVPAALCVLPSPGGARKRAEGFVSPLTQHSRWKTPAVQGLHRGFLHTRCERTRVALSLGARGPICWCLPRFLQSEPSPSTAVVHRPCWILRTEATECCWKMAGRKVLIVYAHQEPKSLNGALKTVAVEELSKQGCTVTVSDLYAMQFEPRATRNDIVGLGMEKAVTMPFYPQIACTTQMSSITEWRPGKLTREEFPLYWFSMPAIMKGWMDRVLVQGFAHEFPNCYDSGLLKNKLALFSFTTGGSKEMYAKGGINGDIRYLLWPMQHGIMHFCGVKVLEPHICFAPEYVSEEKRKEMLLAWAQRLKTLWKEEPINCSPEWYFK
ncbi:ribosyldihydronicotinamide dehydrogenase [quinone] isoform X2 [Anas platyrhynchos]|uniref:ribosyldihydronicotinamide dehydrogenase [quinone] isoform X2 n=1 Tax=Anas platyrhynchos TaxID=8839 RepID=UPI00065E8001